MWSEYLPARTQATYEQKYASQDVYKVKCLAPGAPVDEHTMQGEGMSSHFESKLLCFLKL